MERFWRALNRFFGNNTNDLVESAFAAAPPPQRRREEKPTVVAATGKYLVWTKPGCGTCRETVGHFKRHNVKHEVMQGGVEGYLAWPRFRELLAAWDKTRPSETPFRNAYPIIVRLGDDDEVKLVGGLRDWKREYYGGS